MAQKTTSSGGMFRATDWLGLITAGKMWIDFRDAVDDHSIIPLQCDQLLLEIANFLDGMNFCSQFYVIIIVLRLVETK